MDDCIGSFFELEVQRAQRIRRGEKDGVLPRDTLDREEAVRIYEKKREESRHPDSLICRMTMAARYLFHERYNDAINQFSTLLEFCASGSGPGTQYISLLVSLHTIAATLKFEARQFRLIQYILDNEGDDIMNDSDPILQSIMVDRGFVACFSTFMANHARHIRKYMLRAIDAKDRERAVKLCKRYLTLQKCYDTDDWADLPVKIQQTEELLRKLEFGSLDDLKNVEQTLRVSVSIEASPGTASLRPATAPAFDYAEFLQEKLPGHDLQRDFNLQSSIANLIDAEGIKARLVECEECDDFIVTVPKLVPSSGFIAGMAISGLFVPFLVGIIPLSILAVNRPCHYVQHYCSQCNAPVDDL